MDTQHFSFYIILSNYVWYILVYQNKDHNVRQIRFHVCIKMHSCKRRVCKRKTLFGRPNMSVIANDDEKEETVGRRITGNGHWRKRRENANITIDWQKQIIVRYYFVMIFHFNLTLNVFSKYTKIFCWKLGKQLKLVLSYYIIGNFTYGT